MNNDDVKRLQAAELHEAVPADRNGQKSRIYRTRNGSVVVGNIAYSTPRQIDEHITLLQRARQIMSERDG